MTVILNAINNLTTLKTNFKPLLNLINQHDNIILLRHQRPDPDALGAQLGMKEILQKIFPSKTIRAFGEDVPSLAENLGYMDPLETLTEPLVIVLDTANIERIDGEISNAKTIVKIDHHPNHEPFGDINIVETGVSSTSELVYLLSHCWGYENDYISDESAKFLYMGIVGDTGRFLYDNTSNLTLRVASELKKFDFDATALMGALSKTSVNQFRFTSYLINNFKLNEYGLLYVVVTKEVLEAHNVSSDEASLLINIFRDLEDVKVWFLAIEDEGFYRVRLRSKAVVINDVADYFGGGGHPLASGVRARGMERIDSIVEALNKKLMNN